MSSSWSIHGRSLVTSLGHVVGAGLIVCACAGCGSSAVSPSPTPAPSPLVAAPGDVLPLGQTVRITRPGTYGLPPGASLLRTRCTGEVSVSFTPAAGPPQTNTCHSTTSGASQTNVVTGATQVTVGLGPSAFADLTVS